MSVFDKPVNMMLCAMLASGHLEDIGYAQQGLQCVPVSHHLQTNRKNTWLPTLY